jgi:hypothetical protein
MRHLTCATRGLPRHLLHSFKAYRHFIENFLFALRFPNEFVIDDKGNVFVKLACAQAFGEIMV